jgi:glycosyltransferase involved in cell wall biosynthesis
MVELKNMRTRIVFCWEEVNPYMAACWRSLASRNEVELHVVAGRSGSLEPNNDFSTQIMEGIPNTQLSTAQINDPRHISRLIQDLAPQVLHIPGWNIQSFRRLASDRNLRAIRMVLGMDSPRRDTFRQKVAPLVLSRLFRRMDFFVVPGERSWQLARSWGVPQDRIRRGLYGIDYDALERVGEQRFQRPSDWPRKFIFVGRYIEIKGVDTLVEAYRLYRAKSRNPWPMTVCGRGPLTKLFHNEEGITDAGFVQPSKLGQFFAEHGVFVLPSRFDPWPLVIPEAAASGLPVICTESCGSGVEVVRHLYNGLVVPENSPEALSSALLWAEMNHPLLPGMGRRSQELAAPYSAEVWSERWLQIASQLVSK